MFRSRSASAPPVTLCFVSADVTSRSRSRKTNVTYERNVDQLTSHLATWSNAEVSKQYFPLGLTLIMTPPLSTLHCAPNGLHYTIAVQLIAVAVQLLLLQCKLAHGCNSWTFLLDISVSESAQSIITISVLSHTLLVVANYSVFTICDNHQIDLTPQPQ